jgi:cytochrome P450
VSQSSSEGDVEATARALDHHGAGLDDAMNDYRLLLDRCPIGHSDQYGGFTFVTKHADVERISQDWGTFSAAQGVHVPPLYNRRPMKPIETDPPLALRYRELLLPHLSRQAVAAHEPDIRASVRGLLDMFQGDPIDVSTDFARPIPLITFANVMGLPAAHFDRYDDWVDRIFYQRTHSPEDGIAAADELTAYFEQVVHGDVGGLRETPLFHAIRSGAVEGRPLSEDEQVDICFLLFLGGIETTAWAMRSQLWYLAQHPDLVAWLRQDPSRIPNAIEEMLRYFPPVPGLARTVTAPMTMRDHDFTPGEKVVLMYGAANHDEDVFDLPDTMDLKRERIRHFAFGVGVHRCLGSNLARLEMRTALEEFLSRYPRFTLDRQASWHGVEPLWLQLDPAAEATA